MVSVNMITYNHSLYIAQAIEGVLMQRVNFKIELIIGEDCSTDNTAAIVTAYAEKHPDIIKTRFNICNMGMTINGLETLKLCTGKYIAFCEGDDYWTDPFKLQKQVDFLEANPEYSLCSHRLHCYIQKNHDLKNDWMGELFRNNQNYVDIDIDTFFNVWVTQTVTVVFKKESYDLTDYKKFSYYRDIHLFFNILQKGKGRVFNFYGAVYRAHDQGIWSKTSALSKQKLNLITSRELFNNYNTPFLEKAYYGTLRGYISESIKKGNTVSEFELLLKEVKKIGFEKSLYCKLFLVWLMTKLGLSFLVIYGYKISSIIRKHTSEN